MKRIGIVGHNTELGRLLIGLPNFRSVDDELINGISLKGKVDVLIDCDIFLDVPEFDKKYEDAVTKIRVLHNLHKNFGTKVLVLAPNGKGHPNTILASATRAMSAVDGGKVVLVPVCKDKRELQYVVNQIEKIANNFDTVSQVSTCKRKSFIAKLLGV